MIELPSIIPIFPLQNCILIPGCNLPLQLFEPRYLQMYENLKEGSRFIGIIQPKQVQGRDHPELFEIGTLGEVIEASILPQRRYGIVLKGVKRFVLENEIPDQTVLYRKAQVSYDEFAIDPSTEDVPLHQDDFFLLLDRFIRMKKIKVQMKNIKMIRNFQIINILSQALPFAVLEKQALLEAVTHYERMEKLIALLKMETSGFGNQFSDQEPSILN